MTELTYTRHPKVAIGENRTNETQCLRQLMTRFSGIYTGHLSTDLANTEQDDQELAVAMVLSHKAARINQGLQT